MIYIGIESSCDETSVAVLKDNELVSNLVASQHFHKKYGGVVPELSSRAHLQIISPLLNQALEESGVSLNEVDVISATAGPGLIGAVLVGLTFAKGLALSTGADFIGVNHIEGHIFSGFLMERKPEYPYLCLVVSGGHTLLLIVESPLKIIKLGSTVDDAAGEAFDKVSKLIGLGYPGGPQIQKYAAKGDEKFTKFPVSKLKGKYDFSFSGIKTAVLRFVQSNYENGIPEEDLSNISASFQAAVVKALVQNMENALNEFDIKSISVVGGVAANQKLKESVTALGAKYKKPVVIPELQFCGDNGAMIALRGKMLHEEGEKFDLSYNAFPSLKKGGMKYWYDVNGNRLV